MKKYLNILQTTEFFCGIPDNIILSIVESTSCYVKNYHAGATIYDYGSSITYAGIVLDGEVDVIHSSANGNESIVSRFPQGHLFGASFSCTETTNNLNHFRSITESTILFININLVLRELYSHCDYYLLLMENIMSALATSNIRLNTKIQVLTQKTLREKLLTYFELLAKQNHSREFTLSFNREQLASYLGSERSSLCRELSKLSDEKIIEINRNQVILLI